MSLRGAGTVLLVAILIGAPNVATAQTILLSCSGTLSTTAYGLSSVQNQTLEIVLNRQGHGTIGLEPNCSPLRGCDEDCI
jgi:hypothetical protein